jgi:hypothetical protein
MPGATRLFEDKDPLQITFSADFKKIRSNSTKRNYEELAVPAWITVSTGDSATAKRDSVMLRARGKLRRDICSMPPLQLNCKPAMDSVLRDWGTLKLVCGCGPTEYDEQLVLKEYLAYAMYNLITEKSFRARLVKITFANTAAHPKPYTQYGMLLEDADDMARRNGCYEVEDTVFTTPATNSLQAALMAIFEYMIGNTDFEVQKFHNIKLIRSKDYPHSPPYIVPYDFDFSGFVNARYAEPHPDFAITHVTQRFYRGLEHSAQEIDVALDIFRKAKPAIDALLEHFEPLLPQYRKEATKYIAEFYDIIDDPSAVSRIFVQRMHVP